MPRLAPSQLAVGTLAAVATIVALLALSGAQSVLAISLFVLVGLTLGIVTAARHGRRAASRTQVVARGEARGQAPAVESLPEPEHVAH